MFEIVLENKLQYFQVEHGRSILLQIFITEV